MGVMPGDAGIPRLVLDRPFPLARRQGARTISHGHLRPRAELTS